MRQRRKIAVGTNIYIAQDNLDMLHFLYAHNSLLLILPLVPLSLVSSLSFLLLSTLEIHVEDGIQQIATVNVDLDCDFLLNFQ